MGLTEAHEAIKAGAYAIGAAAVINAVGEVVGGIAGGGGGNVNITHNNTQPLIRRIEQPTYAMSSNDAQLMVKTDKKVRQKTGRHVMIYDLNGWDLSMFDKRSLIMRLLNPFSCVVGHVVRGKTLAVTAGNSATDFYDSDTVSDINDYKNLIPRMNVKAGNATQTQPGIGDGVNPQLWNAPYDEGIINFHRLQHRFIWKNVSTNTVIVVIKEWVCKKSCQQLQSVKNLWKNEIAQNQLNVAAAGDILNVPGACWGLTRLAQPDPDTFERQVGQSGSPIYDSWRQAHYTRIVLPPGQYFEYHLVSPGRGISTSALYEMTVPLLIAGCTTDPKNMTYAKGISTCISVTITGQMTSALNLAVNTAYDPYQLSGGSGLLSYSKESHVCVYGQYKEHNIQLPYLFSPNSGTDTSNKYWPPIIPLDQVHVNPRSNLPAGGPRVVAQPQGYGTVN